MERTPGKWSCRSARGKLCDIESESGDLIAGWLSLNDAAYIVRAVNCHEGLLMFSKLALELAEGMHCDREKISGLRALIAEAEGGGNG